MSRDSDGEQVLPLLERRPYLHGTTLFDAVRGHAPSGARLSFSISKRIDSDRVLIYARSQSEAARPNESARLAWRTAGASGVIGVLQVEPSFQPERRPYDEGLVTERVKVDERSVSLDRPSPFSFVATLIPMFKSLLKATTEMPGAGQWMFTRLDIDRHPDDFIPLKLGLVVMAGALVRSTIIVRGSPVGSLYFSWVRPSGSPVRD
ncbi:hypothetical protein ACQR1K_34440 [Bradyrhizobium sp. HKCCYLRH3095]|uniref:hypothetical protein n=1 Tax=Bradyrhizobium sp. HKCCYLRH3095 TaxID=3420765 RepID=UPI003EC148DF